MDRLIELQPYPSYEALTPAGRDLVEYVFNNGPARPVGRHARVNVCGSVITSKFAYSSEYESGSCEKSYIHLAIHDSSVLDIFHQPKTLSFNTHDKRGRKRPREKTPDFLELGTHAIALVECKPQAKLEELSDGSPDWARDDGGRWHFYPGEEFAARLGMAFRVFCPDVYPAALRANLELASRFAPAQELPSSAVCQRIRDHLGSRPQTVSQLCERFSGLTGASVWAAIRDGHLFGFIDTQLFGPDFLVYLANPEGSSGLQQWEKHPSPAPSGPLEERLASASKTERDKAGETLERYQQRRAQGLPMNSTDFRWKQALVEAQAQGASTLAAFVPRYRDRGGSGPRISAEVIAAIETHALRYLARGGLPHLTKLYADFIVHAEELALPPPSAETHRKYFRASTARERAAFLSGGKRAFHAQLPRTDGARATPRPPVAGLRVHIDGVYGDVRSRPDEDGVFLRPIYYVMVDDDTGYVLGRGVKVGAPHSRAVGMALRDCYLRHGVLPAQIVTDRGSELCNRFVEQMCLHFRMGREFRPAGAPRFGGMGEMLNAQFSKYLQSLSGGTYFDKAGRSADGGKKSRKTATHSITDLIYTADEWLFETWNRFAFGANTDSPEATWNQSLQCFPEAVIPAQDSALARYHTSPPLGRLKFDPVRGMKYGGRYYTSELMLDLLRRHETVSDPRLDCRDPSTLHVDTKRGPIELHSMGFHKTQGLGDAQSMQRMQLLLQGRAVAKRNQLDRSIKEARQIREMNSVLPALSAPVAEPCATSADGHDGSCAVDAHSICWDDIPVPEVSLPSLGEVPTRGAF